jgi:hypothetical protein
MPYKVWSVNEILTASDMNTYVGNQTVLSFAGTAARATALAAPVEGMVSYLEDTDSIEVYAGTAVGWVHTASAGTPSYAFVETVYFTSSGTFTKADYPWLRAIRVKCQGAGGGGGRRSGTEFGAGGNGGNYAESFITDIAGLDAEVSVTRGAGGAGATTTDTNGGGGGDSSFGSLVVAKGGSGAAVGGFRAAELVTTGNVGDLVIFGGGASSGGDRTTTPISTGGGSHLGSGANSRREAGAAGAPGANGGQYGGGAGGSSGGENAGTGANGIVIVELYG